MWIKVVGIGPGNSADLTFRAHMVLQEAEVILGYRRYVERLRPLFEGKKMLGFGMGEELLRCRETLRLAHEGWKVALVSGGDPGIYGMAGLLLEVAFGEKMTKVIEVVPGVSAMNSAAAALGAPLGNDFAVVSLSDYLTSWDQIAALLEVLAQTPLVLVLYNPGSSLRTHTFPRVVTILRRYRQPQTLVGIVRDASFLEESVTITTLKGVENHSVDMRTIVIVGSERTFMANSYMVTPRGYRL
ncbi:MAG: precorrin-3B C(17)-methyltransferase [Atribacterota bacterium]